MMFNSQDLPSDNSYVTHLRGNQLAKLKPALRGGYNISRCMEGTREGVLRKINQWLSGPDTASTPNIIWINGNSGAGKSAVAATVVSNLVKLRRLGSAFFCRHGDANLGDPTAFWRTVASDLCQFHPSLKASAADFLSQPGFRDEDLLLHFECLIEDILTANYEDLQRTPPVIVLDGLDELGSDVSQFPQQQILLRTLTRWSRLPRSLKLIITSNNARIPGLFSQSRVCRVITLETGDSTSDDTHGDIRLFFEKRLSDMRPTFDLPPTWPGKRAIDLLTERAAGLFIWAQTAMAFVAEKRGSPTSKLKLVLAGGPSKQGNHIDTLYRHILSFSFEDANDATFRLFRMIIGAIIVAKVPLYRDDLKHFLHVLGEQDQEVEWEIDAILFSLSSVIELDGTLRLKHTSFAEFLSDPARCREPHFLIDRCEHHRNMVLACLRVMNAELRFNRCNFESSYTRNQDVLDLQRRITTNVPTRLLYSCRFWVVHLSDATKTRNDRKLLSKEVETFFYVHFLHWLEIMSLINEIPASSVMLLTAAQQIEVFDTRLSDFARDSSRFIVNFQTPISESVPHIYLSALPFSPRRSLVSEKYISKFPNTLSVVAGREDRWPALVNVLMGHTKPVSAIAYSSDGKRVVSGSADKTVYVWEVETGKVVAGPLTGHTDAVLSVAYSPDGKAVVSGSADKLLCTWDVKSGRLTAAFRGHTNAVLSVAYAPDGKQVVSGSEDKTLRIWNVETTRVLKAFHGHTKAVHSVAYAPDGKQVASGSLDKTLRMWDIETGRVVVAACDHEIGLLLSLVYSPDGKRIVSGWADNALRVWDVQTGQMVASCFFEGHTDSVLSVAYSPDGKYFVSGSADKTIRVWDIDTGQMMEGPFKGHTYWVHSVAYSPDGKQVISGSADRTVRVWDIETAKSMECPFEEYAHSIRSVAYSPDGKQIVSGASDKSLRVWDVKTGRVVVGPLMGHKHPISSVAYSPDGNRIVSGSVDKTLRVWNIQTGQARKRSFKGHTGAVLSVAYSSDGRVVSGSSDKTLRVWDVETGKVIVGPLKGHTGMIWSVAYSPDGKSIVSGSSDGTLLVWDAKNGEVKMGPFQGHTGIVSSVAYSPDGKRVVSGSFDKTVRTWDVKTGQTVAGPFIGPSWVWAVAYSPNGRHVVSGSSDEMLRVWDIKTGQVIAGPLEGHAGCIRSVAYSPNGKFVVSGSDDEALRVWKAEARPISTHRVGPNIFGSCRHWSSNGWATQTIRTSLPNNPILFWVPPHPRRGLCDGKQLSVLGAHHTRLDLSRFVHGRSWTDCYRPE